MHRFAAVTVLLCLSVASAVADSLREINFMYGMDESIFHPTLTTGGNGNGEFQVGTPLSLTPDC